MIKVKQLKRWLASRVKTDQLVKHEYLVIKKFWLHIDKQNNTYEVSDVFRKNKPVKGSGRSIWTEWRTGKKPTYYYDYENNEVSIHKSTKFLERKGYIKFIRKYIFS